MYAAWAPAWDFQIPTNMSQYLMSWENSYIETGKKSNCTIPASTPTSSTHNSVPRETDSVCFFYICDKVKSGVYLQYSRIMEK